MTDRQEAIAYSRGLNKFDNNPEQRQAISFSDFKLQVLNDRSKHKGEVFICAPLAKGKHQRNPIQYSGETYWRLKENVLPRLFVPFDLDGFIEPRYFEKFLEIVEEYQGFGYTTSSHTAASPRARIVLAASRPVTRSECIRVCSALQSIFISKIGPKTIKFDESVYRGEQPIYTPVGTPQEFDFKGSPVDIDLILSSWEAKANNHTSRSLIDDLAVTRRFDIPETILDGEGRESFILRYASHLRASGLRQSDIDRICLQTNNERLRPPLPADVVLDRTHRYASLDISQASASDWPLPSEVPDSLPKVATFKEQLLPDGFRPWIRDIAERMQSPIEFLAVGAMVASGAVIGNRIGIQPKQKDTGWIETPNIWGAVVGRPGVMKSPALSQVLAPLRRLEDERQKEFESIRAKYELDKLIYEATKKQISAQIAKNGASSAIILPTEPEVPQPKRLLINDATYQKLGLVLSGNPNGVLVFQDELTGLLKRLDSDGQEAARAFYLEAWDGKQSYTFDRVERGTIRIPKLCLSLLGGLQPSKLAEYLKSAVTGGSGDDGLAQRFQMLVYPDISKNWQRVDRPPDVAAAQDAESIFHNLASLDPLSIGATKYHPDGIPALRFSDRAQELFNSWWASLETSLRQETRHPALESHLSKYRKLIPALALLDHLISGVTGAVGEESLKRALRWHLFLFSHAERAYAAVTSSNTSSARALLDHIKGGDLGNIFTARDVYRRQWRMLSTPHQAWDAIEKLQNLGWIRELGIDGQESLQGRPTKRFITHPAAKTTSNGGFVS